MNRGDVYWVDLKSPLGSEANKRRPCVIVSRGASNCAAATVTIMTVTSDVRRIYPSDVYLENVLDKLSKVQANQVRTISKERLSGALVTEHRGRHTRGYKELFFSLFRTHFGTFTNRIRSIEPKQH